MLLYLLSSILFDHLFFIVSLFLFSLFSCVWSFFLSFLHQELRELLSSVDLLDVPIAIFANKSEMKVSDRRGETKTEGGVKSTSGCRV